MPTGSKRIQEAGICAPPCVSLAPAPAPCVQARALSHASLHVESKRISMELTWIRHEVSYNAIWPSCATRYACYAMKCYLSYQVPTCIPPVSTYIHMIPYDSICIHLDPSGSMVLHVSFISGTGSKLPNKSAGMPNNQRALRGTWDSLVMCRRHGPGSLPDSFDLSSAFWWFGDWANSASLSLSQSTKNPNWYKLTKSWKEVNRLRWTKSSTWEASDHQLEKFCRHTDRYLSRDSSSTKLHTGILLALAVQQSQGDSRHKEAATKACQGSQCVAARNGRRFPQPQSTGGQWSSATLTKSSQSLYQLIATYFHEEDALKRPYKPFWVIQSPIVP